MNRVFIGLSSFPSVAATALALGAASAAGLSSACSPLPTMRATVERFYTDNEKGDFDAALSLLSENVVLDSYSEAINGNRLEGRHLVGREAIRPFLGDASTSRAGVDIGLSRTFTGPGGTRYRFEKVTDSGTGLSLELRPDRAGPGGGQANYFRADFGFAKGAITTIHLVEVITWL